MAYDDDDWDDCLLMCMTLVPEKRGRMKGGREKEWEQKKRKKDRGKKRERQRGGVTWGRWRRREGNCKSCLKKKSKRKWDI